MGRFFLLPFRYPVLTHSHIMLFYDILLMNIFIDIAIVIHKLDRFSLSSLIFLEDFLSTHRLDKCLKQRGHVP